MLTFTEADEAQLFLLRGLLKVCFLVTKEVKPYCFQRLIMALFGDYGRSATLHKYVFIFVMYVLFS